jgi:hypothetical protein
MEDARSDCGAMDFDYFSIAQVDESERARFDPR